MSTQETPVFRAQAKAVRAHPAPNNAGAILLVLALVVIVVAALSFGAPALQSMRAHATCASEVAAASSTSCAP